MVPYIMVITFPLRATPGFWWIPCCSSHRFNILCCNFVLFVFVLSFVPDMFFCVLIAPSDCCKVQLYIENCVSSSCEMGTIIACKYRRIMDYGVQRHFQQYFSYILAVSFIGRRNQTTRRKPPFKYNTRLPSKIFQSWTFSVYYFHLNYLQLSSVLYMLKWTWQPYFIVKYVQND